MQESPNFCPRPCRGMFPIFTSGRPRIAVPCREHGHPAVKERLLREAEEHERIACADTRDAPAGEEMR